MMEGLNITTGGSSSSLGLAAAAAADDDLLGTIKGIGVMGSLLYTAMLCLVGWRTHAFFRGGGDGTPAGVFPAKAFFHLFLLASCLSDLPYYYKLGAGVVSKSSYSLHLVAILLDLCAFSMLCVAWSRPLQISQDHEKVLTTVLALDSFVLIYTFVVIALVIISSTDVDHFVASSPQPYLFFFLVHGLALLVFCTWLLAFGIRLQRAIRAHPRWEPVRRERRLRITMRINGVLFLCGACFLLRVALLLAHFVQAEAGDERAMLAPGAIVSWYLFATWIPFVVPACTLLLMMRPGAPGFGGAGQQQPPTPATVGLISSPSHLLGQRGPAGGSGKDWGELLDEPLVSPTASTQPLVAREVLARLQRGNLYSPPAGEGLGMGKGGRGGGGGGGRGGKGYAMLDLGEGEEEDASGVDAERKDERTSAGAVVVADGKGRVKGDDDGEGVPFPQRLSVEAV